MINFNISVDQVSLIKTAYVNAISAEQIFQVALNYLCLAMGAFFICIWIASKSNKIYLIAGITIIAWSCLNAIAVYQIKEPQLFELNQYIGMACQLCVFGLTVILIIYRSEQKTSYKKLLILLIFCLSCIAIKFIASIQTFKYYSLIDIIPFFTIYFYFFYLKEKNKISSSVVIDSFLMLQSFLIFIIIIHDVIVFNERYIRVTESAASYLPISFQLKPVYYTDISMLLLLVMVGAILVNDYQEKTAEVTYANDRLNSSMAKLRTELDDFYKEKSSTAASNSAQIERERIYQDLHDGLGSRLTRLLFQMSSKNVSIESIKEEISLSIDELRLIVNSQTITNPDFFATVFAYCFKLDEELQDRNILVYYDIEEGYINQLDMRAHIMLLRILQEAVTNSLKHSNGNVIRVSCKSQDEYLYMSISDNGKGLDEKYIAQINIKTQSERPTYSQIIFSRGIVGMRRRTFCIGGEIYFSNTFPGLMIEIKCTLSAERRFDK